MGCEKSFRPLTAVLLGTLLSAGCYSAAQLRVPVQLPPDSRTSCVHAIDRVFADAGFERVRIVTGPDMFYTPRTNPGSSVPLQWGIGAWLNHDDPNRCALEIEAISADPAPGPPPPPAPSPVGHQSFSSPETLSIHAYTTQRGEAFDAAVREMARRLQLASATSP
jgi:hypothetical protein